MPPTIAEIVVGDAPAAWEAAGFVVDDDHRCVVGSVVVRLVGETDGRRIRRWALRDPARPIGDDLDGLPTTATSGAAPEPVTHPNGVRHIDHVVIVSPDGPRTVQAFTTIGWTPRRTRRTDTSGSPMDQTFFRAGEVVVELVAPTEAGAGPSAFFGLAHTADDLDALAARLGPALGRVKPAVQPGRRIATLRHRELGMSVATAFLSPAP